MYGSLHPFQPCRPKEPLCSRRNGRGLRAHSIQWKMGLQRSLAGVRSHIVHLCLFLRIHALFLCLLLHIYPLSSARLYLSMPSLDQCPPVLTVVVSVGVLTLVVGSWWVHLARGHIHAS